MALLARRVDRLRNVAERARALGSEVHVVPVDLAITGIVDEVDMESGPRRGQPTAVWHLPSSDEG